MDTKTVMTYQRSFSSAPILIYILRNRPNHMSLFLFFQFDHVQSLLVSAVTQKVAYMLSPDYNLSLFIFNSFHN